MNRDDLPVYLAICTVAGFVSLLWILAFHEVPAASHDILMASTGTMGSAFMGVIGYYFGSSAGSAKKTEIMAQKEEEPK